MSSLFLGIASTVPVQAAPPRKAEELKFPDLLKDHPELTCSAIASLWAGEYFAGTVTAAKATGLTTGNLPLSIVIALGGGAVSSFVYLSAYNDCIRMRNKSVGA